MNIIINQVVSHYLQHGLTSNEAPVSHPEFMHRALTLHNATPPQGNNESGEQ